MYYIYSGPHKDSSTRVSVGVCVWSGYREVAAS